MKNRLQKWLAAFLCVVMLLSVFPSGVIFAVAQSGGSTEGRVDFATSFEEGENEDLHRSEEDGKPAEGVIHTPYGVQGPGLPVNIGSISGSPDYLGSENKYNLFDGKPRTKFLTGSSTGYVQFALKEAATVATYAISSANDEPTRDPKNWTLYGSKDGQAWVELDSRSGICFTDRYQTLAFTVDEPLRGEYLWYKLEVTSNQGGSLLQFSGIDLYPAGEGPEGEAPQQPSGITYGEVLASSITATTANAADQEAIYLFDGSTGTKYLTMHSAAQISFALRSPMVINFYSITSANDHDPRDPRDWDFYGSVDGQNWVLLDSRKGEDFAKRFQTNSYPIDDPTAYKWFKLDVLSNNGKDAVGLDIVQMSELAVGFNANAGSTGEEEEAKPVYAEVDLSTVTATAPDGSKLPTLLFDGNTSTKYLTRNSAADVVFALQAAMAVNFYEVTAANDHAPRDPRDWNFYGSADGESWVLLDSREGENFDERYQTNCYTFENTTEYLWYKWEITSNHGKDAVGLEIVQVSELALGKMPVASGEEPEEPVLDEDVIAEVDLSTVTATTPDGSKLPTLLFDGNSSTRYLTRNSAAYVTFALTSPMAINFYEITSGVDHPPRDPRDWDLYGSSDGENWVLLDHREGEDFAERFQTNRYEFVNETEYLWYKWDITSNHGKDAVGLDIVQVAELSLGHMTAAPAADPEEPIDLPARVDASTATATAPNGGDVAANLFDGNPATKYLTINPAADVVFALTEAMAVNYYTVTSANDHDPRDPRDWNFYGSSDGQSWVLLDSRKGENFAERFQTNRYVFINETPYLWYKWEVTSNHGKDAVGLEIVQASELALGRTTEEVEAPPKEPVDRVVDPATVTGTAPDGSKLPTLLFDGNPSTKYLTRNTAATVVFALQESAVVNRYIITSANDCPQRDPRDWNFYGSADGETWVLLDSRKGEDFAERLSAQTYSFHNDRPYLWYKWEITSYHSTDPYGLDIIQVGELQLQYLEEEPLPIVPIVVDLSTVTGTAELSASEGKKKLFDGKEDTKLVVSGNGFTVQFALVEAAIARGYSLTSANDWDARDPKCWTVEASVNGTDWVVLDTQSGVTFGERFETKTFKLDNATPYLWYRLTVTERAGNNAYTQLAEFTLLDGTAIPEEIPGMESKEDFGPMMAECNAPGAWSGNSCLAVYGEQSATTSFARNLLFDGLYIPVDANTRLSYVIFPGLFDLNSYDYEYTSCRVIIDLHFTDGSYLSDLGARDQYGSLMTPRGQVEGECLVTAQWNYVESCIGDVAAGKVIDRICVLFEMEDAEDASRFITYFDDLKIESRPETVYEHLSDYIYILRGTNNDSAFSRGLCTPAVTMPQGFNFYSPVNNPSKPTACYNYQVSGQNHPMDSLTVTHAPNYWIGSYGSWQFMANSSVDTAAGTAGITASQISSDARASAFTHANEVANAHYYSVTFNEGTPASSVKVEITPTSHAAYVRFTFPEGSENANVIFDSLWGSGTLRFAEDGKTFYATTEHNSAGSSTMYVVGSFDQAYASASVIDSKKGIVAFEKGTTTVTMKLATSFLSFDQAAHSMALEIGNGSFESVFTAAQGAWDALCSKFEIEGASYHELRSFYSNLYRMYAFPNLLSENEGSNEEPAWVYKSPYTKKKTEGILYTNNGFWDTYRTTWAGYSLFTAAKDGELLNGIAQHYVDSGWLPRWLGPGAVNCMVGTSSDIIFADAYIKGIDFNYEAAWESMVKNASAYASNMTAGGRAESNTSPFRGYVTNATQEGYSSSVAGYMDDYGIYRMALAMGKTAEAAYYRNRSLKYPTLFSKEIGFFLGKSATGVFSATKSSYDPAHWNGPKYDYTESVGWVNAFPSTYDGNGLALLYGGRAALGDKLDALFDDSIDAMRKVVNSLGHELREFKEVKMGQYEHNNQPAHHIIYTYAFTDRPYKIQEYTREVLRHVYVGTEIGQGYPGDEDNGEMSAWYIFNALGFYPYAMASGEYVIGSPLYDKVTVHLDNGNDIVIVANNNSNENVYIQSATLNGEAFDRLYITHKELTDGCTLVFEMGNTPSAFGSSEDARPTSLSSATELAGTVSDLTDGIRVSKTAPGINDRVAIYSEISSAGKLFDGDSLTEITVADGAQILFGGKQLSRVELLTLTSGADRTAAPTGFTLEASQNGKTWTTLLEGEISFLFDRFVQPYEIPAESVGEYRLYRLMLLGGGTLSEIELIGSKREVVDPSAGYTVGDVNMDKAINISDVTALLVFIAADETEKEAAYENGQYYLRLNDLNGDGIVSIADITVLLTRIALEGEADPSAFLPGDAYQETDSRFRIHWSFGDPTGSNPAGSIAVTVSDPVDAGTYTVVYGDNDGVLAGYKPIGSFRGGNAGTVTAVTVTSLQGIPATAKAIAVCSAQGDILAYEEIPASKRGGGKATTTFAAISDVHVFNDAAYGGAYTIYNGTEDLKQAVKQINKAGVDFTSITGDLIISFSGEQSVIRAELEKSTGILKDLEQPVYVIKGNHDKRVPEEVWTELTGCETDYSFERDGDLYIYLSLQTVQNVDSNDVAPYGSAKLAWLQEQLDRNPGKRVFLFMHYPFYGYSGLLPGQRYGFTASSTEEAAILRMIEDHGDVIVFSGHTHFDFAATGTYPEINVCAIGTNGCYAVHLPSVAYPRNAANATVTEESEGYIVRVTADGVLLEGMDFVTGEYDPAAIWYFDIPVAG